MDSIFHINALNVVTYLCYHNSYNVNNCRPDAPIGLIDEDRSPADRVCGSPDV